MRKFVAFLFACVSCAAVAQLPATQAYPSRPVRMLIPFPAGSAADIIARAMEPQMRELLGQSLVVDNRGGAGGNIAADLTAKSAPDGYTIMMATIGTHAINHSLYSRLTFHPMRDFTHVALVGESPNALVTTPKTQANRYRIWSRSQERSRVRSNTARPARVRPFTSQVSSSAR